MHSGLKKIVHLHVRFPVKIKSPKFWKAEGILKRTEKQKPMGRVMKWVSEKDCEEGFKAAADRLPEPRAVKDLGQELMLTVAEAVDLVGSPEEKAFGLLRKLFQTLSKSMVCWRMERSTVHLLCQGLVFHFKKRFGSHRVNIIIFPQIHYLFPLMSILALNFLTLWWINFVLVFINALFTFPWVKFWLVIRFCVSAVVRHCCRKPGLRKMNFVPLGKHNYLKKV